MKIDRLFSIVNVLVNKKTVTAVELADKFNVSVRTIYRDIECLSANGIPVYSTQGKGGGISILEGYSIDKTMLSDNEQKQILVALESVNATGQINVNESLMKLANVFHKDNTNWIEIDFAPWSQNENDKRIFELIKNSIFNNNYISIKYFNNKGEKTNRTVEPYKLVFKSNSWYLYGFCIMKNDFRFFKLTRIEEIKVINDKFKKRNLTNKKYSYEYKEETVNVIIKVDESMGFRVYDEFRNGIIKAENGYFLVQVDLPNQDWIYNYLLSYGDAIQIMEPSDIKDEFVRRINKIVKKYV